MTQPENGGAIVDDAQKSGATDTDVQTQLDEMKAQLEALKKESAGKDKAISKYQKEIEAASLANKTADEQLAYFKEQTAAYERKEAFRQAFKEIGLNPDEFIEIVDEKEPKFKTKELEKKGGVPQTTDKTVVKTHADVNALIRGAFNR